MLHGLRQTQSLPSHNGKVKHKKQEPPEGGSTVTRMCRPDQAPAAASSISQSRKLTTCGVSATFSGDTM